MLLPSFMAHILNRFALIVAVIIATLFAIGCSSVSSDPQQQANDAITDANKSIAEHNTLFNQSRSTYEEVKNELESGGDPSRQEDRIAQTRDTLEEAQSNLQDAQDSLSSVEDLEVDPVVKEYARLLSGAMDAQIEAEDTEIEFYNTLEEDPALENTRQRALDLLSQADASYQQAQDRYAQAREVATRNPELISLPRAGESTSPQ